VYKTVGNSQLLSIEEKGENESLKPHANNWLLNANLVIERDASFFINSSDTAWLKINSTNDSAYKIESHGNIAIDSVKISSWDTSKDTYSRTDSNGTIPRSYIFINSSTGTANISNSEIAHMGYSNYRGFGITYHSIGKSSIIENNNIHDLWYGFSFDTNSSNHILVQNNKFYNNGGNGIYLHDGAHDIIIRNNTIYDNGKHGLICSKNCNNIYIELNRIFHNSREGVIFYENITNSMIRNNMIYDNKGDQIYLDRSSHNKVYDNDIGSIQNAGIRVTDGSTYNNIFDNVIERSRYGIYLLKQSSHNILRNNEIINSSIDGIFLHSGATSNILEYNAISNTTGNGIHVKDDSSKWNVLKYNQIQDSRLEGIKLSAIGPRSVLLLGNLITKGDPIGYQNHLSNPKSTGPFVVDKDLKIEVVYDGIKLPTAMAFVDNNDILVLEKNTGNILRITNKSMQPEPLLSLNVSQEGERGLLGIAVSQDIRANITYVFLYLTEAGTQNGESESCKNNTNLENSCRETNAPSLFNRLIRYELSANGTKLIHPKSLLNVKALPGPIHNGGNVIIGPDGNLYVGIGDVNKRTNKTQAQNVEDGGIPDGTGGILQLTQDGLSAANIFSGGTLETQSVLDKYYAYGIRNTFGMDFDPLTDLLWDTENGPNFGDEINLVEPGFNSGWQQIQGIWTPDGAKPGKVTLIPNHLVEFDNKGKYRSPELTWRYSTGLTALKFLDSDKIGKQYENDLLVSEFNGGNIFHFDLNPYRNGLSLKPPLNDRIVNFTEELDDSLFASGFVGITDLEVGPDGYLYVLSLSDDIKNNCGGKPCAEYDSYQVEGKIYRISRIDS
jgi:parallel beta-helix repeat protein